MNTTGEAQNKLAMIKGSVPVKIKNTWLGILIVAGCIVPPILGYMLGTGPDHHMPNKQAALFLIPMSISFVLLPFTGILRKILYAIPLPIILLVTFWPLFILWIIEKIRNPQADLKKHSIFSMWLWVLDAILSVAVGWLLVGIGTLMLTMTVVTFNK